MSGVIIPVVCLVSAPHSKNRLNLKGAIMDLYPLERNVINKLLAGENACLSLLREQFAHSQVVRRELSGAGVFIYFDIPEDAPRLAKVDKMWVGDVDVLPGDIGFVLFVENGCIDFLEGYCFGDEWPSDLSKYTVAYHGECRDLTNLCCDL